MPFELGVDYGARLYGGGKLAGKQILILEDSANELKRALSDLAGSDVEPHNGQAIRIPKIVRDWLAQSLADPPAPPSELWGLFNDFTAENYMTLKERNYSDDDIAEQPIRELITSMRNWLRPPAP